MVKKRVLNDPVIYPEKFSEKARSICEGLLVKEPERRLGFRNGSCDELRDHPFFAEINWIKLNAGPFEFSVHCVILANGLLSSLLCFCVQIKLIRCKHTFCRGCIVIFCIYLNSVPVSVLNIKNA